MYENMIVLKRTRLEDDPIQIVPLDATLAARIDRDASRALNGDGRCTLNTMNTSCFASENCSLTGTSGMRVHDLLVGNTQAFVAVDRARQPERFVGCVSVRHAEPCSAYPSHTFQPNSCMISNLCVAKEYRKRRVGKRLIDHAVRAQSQCLADPSEDHHTYLEIALHDKSSSPLPPRESNDCARVFDHRVKRLLTTYEKLGFGVVDKCSNRILLQR